MKDISVEELRTLLCHGATLKLNVDSVKAMLAPMRHGKRATKDLAWLWDMSVETGNSEAYVLSEDGKSNDDPNKEITFDFSNAGTCTCGIVMTVRYACKAKDLSQELHESIIEKGYDCAIYPEDVIEEQGGFLPMDAIEFVEVSYDPLLDEEVDEE